MNRSAIQQWTESFAEALVRRATQLGAGQPHDDSGKRSREILARLQTRGAALRVARTSEAPIELGTGPRGGRRRPAPASGVLRALRLRSVLPSTTTRSARTPGTTARAWRSSTTRTRPRRSASAVGGGPCRCPGARASRTSALAGTCGRWTTCRGWTRWRRPSQRVLHPFWALSARPAVVDGYGTCFLEGHRVSARGMSPESNIISVFRRELGLNIENEYGESSWHDHVTARWR